MAGEPAEAPRELVIIRRRPPDGMDAHKGGVWKIAYADFMTAMMAFFLVMWLINAANEATRSQVASYFNPVKLVDSRTNLKGLQDLDTGADGPARQKPPGESQRDKSEGLPLEAPKTLNSEESLFKDPYVVLAELAKEAGAGPDTDKRKTGVLAEESGRPGLRGGEGFIDPFDPASWRTVAEAAIPTPESPTGNEENAAKKAGTPAKEVQAILAAAKDANAPTSGDKVAPTDTATNDAGVERLKREIERAAGEAGVGQAPLVDVKSTEEGVLVSLTDASDFGMFAIASAKPKPELARFMEKGRGRAEHAARPNRHSGAHRRKAVSRRGV